MTLGHILFAFNVASILLPQRAPETVRTVPAE